MIGFIKNIFGRNEEIVIEEPANVYIPVKRPRYDWIDETRDAERRAADRKAIQWDREDSIRHHRNLKRSLCDHTGDCGKTWNIDR